MHLFYAMKGHKMRAVLAQVNNQTKGVSLSQNFKYTRLTGLQCNPRMQYLLSNRLSKAADLDHHWVAKAWLSDVGLPQYSQAFHNHLVDGRMLNSLTRHDLERHLNITKKFHQVSLLLGIELLQLLQFDKEVRTRH